MSPEETLQHDMEARFPQLAGKIRIPKSHRIWVDVPQENFREVFDFANKMKGFTYICTITGLDEGEYLAFIYHLAQPSGIVMNMKTRVPKAAPILKTVTDVFPAAEFYERELMDLLGARVEGLTPGKHYPLPDDWPAGQYPLRKDWKPEMLDAGAPPKEGSNG